MQSNGKESLELNSDVLRSLALSIAMTLAAGSGAANIPSEPAQLAATAAPAQVHSGFGKGAPSANPVSQPMKSPDPSASGSPVGAASDAPSASPSAAVAGDADFVWVSRPDGALSCGKKKGLSLQEGSKDLMAAGIEVKESRKGQDRKLRAQMCGMPSGSLNSYRIRKQDLDKATAAGYVADSGT